MTLSSGNLLYKGGNGNTITVNNLILDDANIYTAEYAADFTLAGHITLKGTAGGNFNSTWNSVSDIRNMTVSALISGSGPARIYKTWGATGNATVTFASANTYTGATTVSRGTLQAGIANAFGTNSAVTVASGATLNANSFNQSIGSLAGGGNVTLGSATLTTGGDNTSTTFSGTMSGSGSLTKTGTGTLTLTGTNTYSGGTTISGGTLAFASGALGTGGNISMNGGTLKWTTGNAQDVSSRIVMNDGKIASFDTNGNTVTFASGIGDNGGTATSGSLTKLGTGTLILTSANTYTGGTTISGGTLQAGIANAFGTNSAVTVASGATLNANSFNQTIGSLAGDGNVTLGSATLTTGGDNTSTTFSGIMSGSGSLTKTGTGTLTLDGVNTYTGLTTVAGGTLEVGDASHSSASLAGDVTVNNGSTLRGHGTVGGNVLNNLGGIVAPGGSIGTLSVGGNYTQSSSSSLQIEVSPSASSTLNVTGTANLDGKLKLVYAPGVYSAKTYNIVHAGTAVSGTFSTVSSNAGTAITQSLTYTGMDVNLLPSGIFKVAPTHDSVFTAIETTGMQSTQLANTTILSHLAAPAPGSLGEDTQSTAMAPAESVQLAFNGSDRALGAMLPSKSAPQIEQNPMRGWFRATGNFQNLDGNGTTSGYDAQSGGFLAGIDRQVAPGAGQRMTLGTALGYSHTHITVDDGQSATLDTPRFMLYGRYTLGPWALGASAGYAHDFIDAKRPIASLGKTASSSHGADEATGALQISRRLNVGGVTVLPAAGLEYVHLFDGGFTESGASGFDLAVSGQNADSLRPFIGVSATKVFTTDNGLRLIPEADIRYSHELFDTPPSHVTVGGGSFTVKSLTPAHDRLTLGGGLTAKLSNRLALSVGYHAVMPTGNNFGQTVSANLTLRF